MFKELPTGIVQLKNLEILDLHQCKYVEMLPDELGRLSKLKKLDLRWMDALKSLPASLVNLQNLERLEFSGKQLDYCEETKKVAQLRNLKHLHISGTSDSFYIPASFAQLSNLRHLETRGLVDLEQAFAIFTQLENLEYINMESYNYGLEKGIPKTIGDFKNLKSVYLNYEKCSIGQSKELFERLSSIPTLKTIKIHQWTRYLPPEIGLFKQLEELHMVYCRIKTFPKVLLEMTWLKKLDFRGTGLSSADRQLIKKRLLYTEVVF